VARGAKKLMSASVNSAASVYAFTDFNMLHSPFVSEERQPRFTGWFPLLSLICGRFQ